MVIGVLIAVVPLAIVIFIVILIIKRIRAKRRDHENTEQVE